jgi:FkbM family methyltransferase
LPKIIRVKQDGRTYQFNCVTSHEIARAKHLFEKEAGTMQWLKQKITDTDVFYDIGANVGSYTIPAAVLGARRVLAFEPHPANVLSLITNIQANKVFERVSVFSCALHDQIGFFDMHYAGLDAGTSMHQLHQSGNNSIPPGVTEKKYATTVDALILQGFPPPTLVKLDVDGNELFVLRGMHQLLNTTPPRSLLVEMNVVRRQEVYKLLESYCYRLIERQDTMAGKAAIARGNNPDEIAYNAVFQLTT